MKEGRSRRLELFRRWFLVISCYYCTPSVCCRDVLYEFAVNFTLSLMILKDDLKTLETWHYRFLEPFYFLFFWERKKNLRGKNDLLMFKIETYNISIVNKIDLFNLSSGKNLCLDIGCPSEKKKSNTCFIWRKKKNKVYIYIQNLISRHNWNSCNWRRA